MTNLGITVESTVELFGKSMKDAYADIKAFGVDDLVFAMPGGTTKKLEVSKIRLPNAETKDLGNWKNYYHAFKSALCLTNGGQGSFTRDSSGPGAKSSGSKKVKGLNIGANSVASYSIGDDLSVGMELLGGAGEILVDTEGKAIVTLRLSACHLLPLLEAQIQKQKKVSGAPIWHVEIDGVEFTSKKVQFVDAQIDIFGKALMYKEKAILPQSIIDAKILPAATLSENQTEEQLQISRVIVLWKSTAQITPVSEPKDEVEDEVEDEPETVQDAI